MPAIHLGATASHPERQCLCGCTCDLRSPIPLRYSPGFAPGSLLTRHTLHLVAVPEMRHKIVDIRPCGKLDRTRQGLLLGIQPDTASTYRELAIGSARRPGLSAPRYVTPASAPDGFPSTISVSHDPHNIHSAIQTWPYTVTHFSAFAAETSLRSKRAVHRQPNDRHPIERSDDHSDRSPTHRGRNETHPSFVSTPVPEPEAIHRGCGRLPEQHSSEHDDHGI